jgi:hypothetical protein
MFVLMTLALAALLGAMALCTDVAVLYFNWMQLRKAADAAALAGAAYLGPFASAPAQPGSCDWGGGMPAYDVACSYAEINGIAPGEIAAIGPATSLPPGVTIPYGAQTLQISLQRSTIPMFFARVLNPSGSTFTAAVNATAVGPAPLQTMTQGMFPAALLSAYAPSSYLQQVTLTLSGSGSNMVWLDLPACSPIGSAPPVRSMGGGANLSNDINNGSTCSYSIGSETAVASADQLNRHSDEINGAMMNRIQQPDLPAPPLTQLNSRDPQLVVVPIVETQSTRGGKGRNGQIATIEGFASFWIMNFMPAGGSQTVKGEFIEFTADYGIGGAQIGYGAYSKPYLID